MTETRMVPPQAGPRYETRPEKSGWTGWVVFAGIMMMLVGTLHALDGLVAIVKDQVYYTGANARLVVSVDYTTWGWVHLIVGVAVVLAGFFVMTGAMWARIVGICLACLSVVLNIAFLAAYPVWSITIIALDVLVIYALAVHGRELKS